MVSFAVQMLINRSHSFIFVFISIALEDCHKKTVVWFMSMNVLPIISSRSFMVPCLMSKSLRHFEFVFAYGVSTCFNFTDFHAAVQLSQQDLLKRFFVSHSCFPVLSPLSKINWSQVSGVISVLSCCTDLFLFMSVPYYFIGLVLQCSLNTYSILSMAYLFSICPLFWNLKTSILMLLHSCVISYIVTKNVMSYKRKRNDVFSLQYATHSAKSKRRRK